MDANILIQAILLGVGLAMDACAVSMANGLHYPKIKKINIALVCLSFAFFQALMPTIGYLAGSSFIQYIEKFIPWIALIILGFLGGKMLYDNLKKCEKEEACGCVKELTFVLVIVQSFATSIDALSVGFTISNYTLKQALLSALIIAVETFIICILGFILGKKFGDKFGKNAEIFGGVILIAIGIEIFVSSFI